MILLLVLVSGWWFRCCGLCVVGVGWCCFLVFCVWDGNLVCCNWMLVVYGFYGVRLCLLCWCCVVICWVIGRSCSWYSCGRFVLVFCVFLVSFLGGVCECVWGWIFVCFLVLLLGRFGWLCCGVVRGGCWFGDVWLGWFCYVLCWGRLCLVGCGLLWLLWFWCSWLFFLLMGGWVCELIGLRVLCSWMILFLFLIDICCYVVGDVDSLVGLGCGLDVILLVLVGWFFLLVFGCLVGFFVVWNSVVILICGLVWWWIGGFWVFYFFFVLGWLV